jgi:hypothetical protein
MNRLLPTMGLLLVACAAEDPRPDDLSEPVVWLYGHFDERDDALDTHLIDLAAYANTFDPESPWADRSFVPGRLDEVHVEDIDGPAWTAQQAKLTVIGHSPHDLDELRSHVEVLDRRCIEAPTAISWSRSITFGEGCFVAGACDESWVEDVVDLGDVQTTLSRRYRTIRLSDGRDATLRRTTLSASAETAGPLSHWYGLTAWIEDEEDARRTWIVQTTWQAGSATQPHDLWTSAQGDSLEAARTTADAYQVGPPSLECER